MRLLSRRNFLSEFNIAHSALLSCTIFSPLIEKIEAAKQNKPNFIIIFTDDQGYQDLGCFGHPTIKTPHIDQMAKEGHGQYSCEMIK